MVIIIDDRADVWNNSPNVIQVRPYRYFAHTGDINAPEGFGKKGTLAAHARLDRELYMQCTRN